MRSIKSIASGLRLGLVALAIAANSASAMPITAPTGLSPGDQYRLAFLTSTMRDATSTLTADYNAFVTSAANGQSVLAALGTTWAAIASSRGTGGLIIDARANTNTDPGPDANPTGVPIYLLNNTKLADHYDDLWDGMIDTPLNVFEDGTTSLVPRLVWTGTNSGGFATLPLGSLAGGLVATAGRSDLTGPGWIIDGSVDNTQSERFYALSGILTAPSASVSEPAPLSLLVLGLVGLAIARRRMKAAGEA